MDGNNELSAIELLKKIEQRVEKAKLETGLHERQLSELLPHRKQMEKESLDKYKCDIKDLPEYKQKLEDKLKTSVIELESDLQKIQGDKNND